MKKVLIVVPVILVIATVGFVGWAETPLGPMPEALDALVSSEGVSVTEHEEGWIVFTPEILEPQLTLIFYPGGRVDERSYAPLLREIAEEGFRVILVPMPLNLAVFDSEEALEVIKAYPVESTWVIGGHSLGGAMAARLVYQNPGLFEGLLLYGSYPADNNSLSDRDLPVLSLYGSEDGGAEEIAESLTLLPGDAAMVMMEGGNHAQFGYYGEQGGDGTASLSREIQQLVTVELTRDFLLSIP